MVGETTASNPALEVSVSFGRFENDSLSWEKWSAFSPNKYLEEVEKCATPGSVAQKKAYFEAHYKKIAAKKAELLEQEKQQAQNDSMRSEDNEEDDPNGGDLIRNTNSKDARIDVSEDQISVEEEVKKEPILSNEKMSGEKINDLKLGVVISEECQISVVEREGELDTRVASPKLGKAEQDDIFVKEVEAISIDSQPKMEAPESLKSELVYDSKVKEEKVKLVDQNQPQKVTAVDKERTVAKAKKKPVSQLTRTPKSSNSTPRVSKPVQISSRVSPASQSSTKKSNTITQSLQRNKNPSSGETKKVVSKSLHMSLSLGPRNLNSPANLDLPAITTPRKSLFMEKMGDKDIVKRAFKAFQNNFNQARSYGDDGSSLQKQVQVTTKRPEPKVSTTITPRKENVGSLKTDRLDKRSVKTPPSSFGFKSDERAEKRKEFSKKLEEKSNAIEEEKTCLQSRSKEAKETEIKKLRQSLNFKATPMPAFYRGQKTSKSTLDKLMNYTVTQSM
ncbi:hypothetical protein L484_027847 [Morus notabilis]|uniref:TPX2 C-terminal domain-containing protein n=1 Tax=Morus notabilis TaxID=981085 RepID=W9RNK3_9ROSA|nr:hypothetical protein L484_027847 [Morus notabilis]